MVKMSSLRNCPVICQDRRLGLLQSVSLDTAQKKVCALIISCGLRGKCMILRDDVLSVCDGFILARNPQKYKRALEMERNRFVRDTTGLLVGYVTDYAIDERKLDVAAIEMISGYWPSEYRDRTWMFAYDIQATWGELTVPVCLGSMTV